MHNIFSHFCDLSGCHCFRRVYCQIRNVVRTQHWDRWLCCKRLWWFSFLHQSKTGCTIELLESRKMDWVCIWTKGCFDPVLVWSKMEINQTRKESTMAMKNVCTAWNTIYCCLLQHRPEAGWDIQIPWTLSQDWKRKVLAFHACYKTNIPRMAPVYVGKCQNPHAVLHPPKQTKMEQGTLQFSQYLSSFWCLEQKGNWFCSVTKIESQSLVEPIDCVRERF